MWQLLGRLRFVDAGPSGSVNRCGIVRLPVNRHRPGYPGHHGRRAAQIRIVDPVKHAKGVRSGTR